jgi:DNA repair protein RadC
MIKDESDNQITTGGGIRCFTDILEPLASREEMQYISLVETRLYRKKSKRYTVQYASTSEKAAKLGRALFLPHYDREYLYAIAFSSKMEPLAATLLSMGGLSSTLVDQGRVFSFAILSAANSIMLFHNHVSGNPSPSKEDENITRRIRDCGNLMGIQLADHIIIGESTYYSMKEGGIL